MKLHVDSEGRYFDVKNMDTIIAFMNYSETHKTTPIRAFSQLRYQNNLIPKCSHMININIALLISFPLNRISHLVHYTIYSSPCNTFFTSKSQKHFPSSSIHCKHTVTKGHSHFIKGLPPRPFPQVYISQVTQFLNSRQNNNPNRQFTITTLEDENYDDKDDDGDTTGHKVQNK